MNALTYYLVDVFTDRKYGGNQLAVFIDFEDKASDEEMLAIARELNFSEITFVKKQRSENTFEVRIFTPEYEVPFAGHPSLGTAYVITNHLLDSPQEEIILSLAYADIPIQLSNITEMKSCMFTMKQAQPLFYKNYLPSTIAAGLAIDETLIDSSKCIEEVTTGLPYIIVPIIHKEGVDAIELSPESLTSFLLENKLHTSNNPSGLSTSLFFISKDAEKEDERYYARMFCLEQGKIMEDAATGSANGCFLAYLLKNENPQVKATVEQGVKMGRTSQIYLEGKLENETFDIYVSGQVTEVGSGNWLL